MEKIRISKKQGGIVEALKGEIKGIFNERKEKAIEEICKHVSFIK